MRPATVVSAISLVFVSIVYFTLPIVELQTFFWVVLAIGFLGDSITTGCLAKFGLEEQEKGYTRWLCGSEPTLICATGTRALAFGILLGLYSLVTEYHPFLEINYIRTAVLMMPIVFAFMSIVATVINSYAMWKVSR
jgi:hypothetical protein